MSSLFSSSLLSIFYSFGFVSGGCLEKTTFSHLLLFSFLFILYNWIFVFFRPKAKGGGGGWGWGGWGGVEKKKKPKIISGVGG